MVMENVQMTHPLKPTLQHQSNMASLSQVRELWMCPSGPQGGPGWFSKSCFLETEVLKLIKRGLLWSKSFLKQKLSAFFFSQRTGAAEWRVEPLGKQSCPCQISHPSKIKLNQWWCSCPCPLLCWPQQRSTIANTLFWTKWFLCSMLEMEPMVHGTLGRHCTTEIHSQPKWLNFRFTAGHTYRV